MEAAVVGGSLEQNEENVACEASHVGFSENGEGAHTQTELSDYRRSCFIALGTACKLLILMVGTAGFEPTTSTV